VSKTLLYAANGDPLLVSGEPELADDVADLENFDPSLPQPGAVCVLCGCSDTDGCEPAGCFWVAPSVCSSCRPDLADYWAHRIDRTYEALANELQKEATSA
jgi:hypothetical protein